MSKAAPVVLLALLMWLPSWVASCDISGAPPGSASPTGACVGAPSAGGPRQPPLSGEWLVSSAEAYSGAIIPLAGNLTVAAGGILTLSNVMLSFASSFEGEFHIEVQAGGQLLVFDRDGVPGNLDDATVISSASSFSYLFWVRDGGRLVFRNSLVKNCGFSIGSRGETAGPYLQSSDCDISNSTFRENYCGLAVDGCAPRLDNCTLTQNRKHGLYLRDSDLAVAGELFDQNGDRGLFLDGCQARLAGNLFRSNRYGLTATRSTLVLERNTFQLNTWRAVDLDRSPAGCFGNEFIQNGLGYLVSGATLDMESELFLDNPYSLYCQDAAVVMRNTSMTNSTLQDIYLTASPTGHSEVVSCNSSFTKVFFNDPASWLAVRWTLVLSVAWESTGAPVPGATVLVRDRNENNLFNFITNATGGVPPFVLTEYNECRAGPVRPGPYRLGTIKGRFFNSTRIDLSSDLCRTLILDDVPPRFLLTAPRDNSTTNKAWINITGNLSVELGASVTVNDTPATVDHSSGNFTARVNLTEGRNVVNVTATDDFMNSYTVFKTVYRDSTPPALEVNVPPEGLLINTTRFLLRGRTEPGSYVRVNGLVPLLDAEGGFEMELELSEGPNGVSVNSSDSHQNYIVANRTVTVDTVPPEIEITSPALFPAAAPSNPPLAGELWTNRAAVRVQGQTEPGAAVFLGEAQLELTGTNFSVSVNLTEGDSTTTFRVRDPAGNWNATSVLFHLDTVPPSANITYPPEGALFNRSPVEIVGTTEPLVTVSSSDGLVSREGTGFRVLCDLGPGPNRITVEFRDRAGNLRRLTVDITFDFEASLQLSAPENYTSTTQSSIRVRGVAEPGSAVTVNGQNASVAPDGSFASKVHLQVGENVISVNVTDAAGNTASYRIVVYRDEPPPVDYSWLGWAAAAVGAVLAVGAGGWLAFRRAAARRPPSRSAPPPGGPMPWEQEFVRPVLKAPEEPEEVLRCAQCLQPIREDWTTCHTCGGPTDLVTVSSQTFLRLAGTAWGTDRERALAAGLQKARSDILLLLDAGEPVPGRLLEATVAAQLLLGGRRLDIAERKSSELAALVGARAQEVGTARSRELEKSQEEARLRLKALLDEIEGALVTASKAGWDLHEEERELDMARVHLRAGNLEKVYALALETKRKVDGKRAGGGP